MKTIYPRSRVIADKRRWWRSVLLTVLVLGLVFAGSTMLDDASGLLTQLARPLWLAVGSVTGGEGTLAGENRSLKNRINLLEAELLTREQLLADNQNLRAALGQLPAGKNFVTARVISSPWRGPHDLMTIDLGRDNSSKPISVGQLVVYNRSILLGDIVQIYAHQSKVRLFSSPDIEVPVIIGEGETAVPATAVGHGSGNFVVTLPRGVEVAKEAIVSTTVVGEPLVLGIVGEINQEPSESLQHIFLRSPLNLAALEWVQIYEK